MKKQSPTKQIIKDAQVEGFVFCSFSNQQKEEKSNDLLESYSTPEASSISTKFKKSNVSWKYAEQLAYQRGLKEGQQQGYEVGKSEGLDIGLKEGFENAKNALKSVIDLLNHITESFQNKQKEMFEVAKPEIIKFSLAVCESVLRRELESPKTLVILIETLLNQAKAILKDLSVDVILSTDDMTMLEKHLGALTNENENFKGLNFIPDKSIERGNCRLETSLGLINFDIKRILSDLEKNVLEVDQSQNNP